MGINEEKYKTARTLLLQYIRKVAHDKNITHLEIAEKTGFSQNNVSRMLMGRYPPKLDNFLKLAEAAGVYFFVIDKDADDDLVTLMKERWGKITSN